MKRELIAPYNPQQNGIFERKNKTIMDAAKAMIHDQELSMFLWGEVSNTIVYFQNKSPHRILGNKSPEEVFTGERLEVSHLRIFCYPVYIHVPKEKRTKLEAFGKNKVFVGYSESSEAYKILVQGQ